MVETKKTRAAHVRTVLVFCLEMRDKYGSCVEIQAGKTLSAPHFHALTILLGIRQILKVHCFVIVFSDDLLDFL